METYKPFLQIECKHTFYKNEYLAGFTIKPTPATAQVMRTFGLVAKNTTEGISLYYSTASPGLLDSASDTISLTFYLELQNPDFFIITDLEGYDQQKFLNFSNENTKQDGNILLLHEGEYVSQAEIKERSDIGQNLELITIDLDPKTLKEDGEIKMRNYEIKFKAREVYWRYYILKSSDSTSISDLSISVSGSDVSFSDSGEATLSNGAKAMMLKSTSPLELKERYNFTHSLNFLLSRKAATMNLPMPDGKGLQKENGEIYADIYVYVA